MKTENAIKYAEAFLRLLCYSLFHSCLYILLFTFPLISPKLSIQALPSRVIRKEGYEYYG